jgi:hypothetical protein
VDIAVDGIISDHGVSLVGCAPLGLKGPFESARVAGQDGIADVCWNDGDATGYESVENALSVSFHIWATHGFDWFLGWFCS